MINLLINNEPLDNKTTIHATDFAEWSPIELACAPLVGARSVSLRLGGEDLGAPTTSPFDPIWRWRWIPRGVAGLVRGELVVTLADASTERQTWTLLLRPRLLDEQTWASLLDDIAVRARALAVTLGGAAFANALLVPLRPDDRTPLEEALALLERHSRDLEHVTRSLVARPESTLRPIRRRQVLSAIRAPDPNALSDHSGDVDWAVAADESPAVGQIRARLGGALPRTVATTDSADSADLPEHRWLVGLIELVERRLRQIRTLIETERARSASERQQTALRDLAGRTERALGGLRRLRNAPPLAGLPARRSPPQSQRSIRDRRFRPLRRIWRELRESPLLTLEVGQLALPINDLPTLYEQWCALAVADALAQTAGTLISQQMLVEDANRERWTLHLPTAAPLLELQTGDVTWRLRYQPRYTTKPDALHMLALDGYTRIPDLVLERIAPNEPPTLFVFDAKYRRAPDGRAPQDALDDAYAYRGSLGANGESRVRYAAILYPHDGVTEDFGSVGALPLLPNHRESLVELLAKLMR